MISWSIRKIGAIDPAGIEDRSAILTWVTET
jgi:hypothetical protein